MRGWGDGRAAVKQTFCFHSSPETWAVELSEIRLFDKNNHADLKPPLGLCTNSLLSFWDSQDSTDMTGRRRRMMERGRENWARARRKPRNTLSYCFMVSWSQHRSSAWKSNLGHNITVAPLNLDLEGKKNTAKSNEFYKSACNEWNLKQAGSRGCPTVRKTVTQSYQEAFPVTLWRNVFLFCCQLPKTQITLKASVH